jgi:hypothetical protein
MSRIIPFVAVRQKATKVLLAPKTTTIGNRQLERHARSPFKSPFGRSVPPTKARHRQGPPIKSLILEKVIMV